MEKLIELLNEYEAKRHKTSVIANIRKGEEDRLSYLEMNWNYSELLCISKGYEFIKRLVENDKIDHKLVRKYEKIFGISIESGKEYEIIIILLAISDTPIEDLILYLR